MLELGHPQIRDGNEVGCRSEPSGGALGLLQQAVHRLHIGVTSVVQHAAHHPSQALLQSGGQFLEGIEPTAPGPADPAQQVRFGLLSAVVLRCFGVNRTQRHLQPPCPRTFKRRALQPVHGVGLLDAPALWVSSHAPSQTLEQLAVVIAQGILDRLGLRAHLLAAHAIHGLIGHGNHMKAVVADLGLGQSQANALGVGSAHVLADMFDLSGLSPVSLEVISEVHYGLVVAPLAGKQQPLGIQVMHHRDVALSFAQAGLVNANHAHLAHIVQRARRAHVMLNAPPQLFVRAAQQRCGLAHRQLLAQRQSKGFKQRSKPAAFARPGNIYLRCLGAGATGNAGHFSVQPGFKLEEVQVPPLAGKPVMHALIGRIAVRARQAAGIADEVEVDAPTGRVKLDILDAPRRLQAKCAGKVNNASIPTAIWDAFVLSIEDKPGGFVDNSEYRVPHKPHRALLLSILLAVKLHTE